MTNAPAEYEATAQLTVDGVGEFKAMGRKPEFALPPRELALIASLKDIGLQLACNDEAVDLVVMLLARTDLRGLPDYPTAMMLRVALDHHGIPWKEVTPAELGFLIPKGRS